MLDTGKYVSYPVEGRKKEWVGGLNLYPVVGGDEN